MSPVALEILFIVLLVLVNGIFAMSEMAVVSARKARLQQRTDEGNSGARAALELANSPNQFLSTIQIGITLIGILAGAFGGATIAEELAKRLSRIHPIAPYSEAIGVGVVVIGITYFSLVIGELAPKRLALSNAERIASVVAPSMQVLSKIASPVVSLLSLSTETVLRIVGVRLPSELPVTEEEIKLMIKQGTQVGVFEPTEQEMIERVFHLDDRSISALMTPRPEVVWLDVGDPFEDICSTITARGHSSFPVAQDSLDNVLGVVQARDLLTQSLSGQSVDVKAVMRPALFVPESMSALEVLERFKEARSHIALVIDEYGGFQGLVTINDILEAIVGAIPLADETVEMKAVQREDGSWLLDGRLLVEEFKELLQIEKLLSEEAGRYQTLGGFVMDFLGRIPSTGDYFELGGLRFEIVDMDRHRVDKVLVMPMDSHASEEILK